METEVIKVDPQAGIGDAVARATELMSRGGLVAFPTETVYGLGARADDLAGVERLREIKSRKINRAFTLHLASPSDARRFTQKLSGLASRLIRKAWPGPLTLIVPVEDPSSTPAMQSLSESAVSSIYFENTIGLRCPDDPIAAALLRAVDAPVVATSANPTGGPSPRTGNKVIESLGGKIDLLIDAGPTKHAKPSTIVRIEGSSYRLLREGVYDAGIIRRLSVLRLLLVCTGNTCRSPMAEGLAESMLAERLGCHSNDLAERGIEIRSAGTGGGGYRVSTHAVAVMAQRGIDIASHVPTALTCEMAEQADHIFVMTRGHRDVVVGLAPSCENRVSLLLDGCDVQDPIGGMEDEYEQAARAVEQGLEVRLRELSI